VLLSNSFQLVVLGHHRFIIEKRVLDKAQVVGFWLIGKQEVGSLCAAFWLFFRYFASDKGTDEDSGILISVG
jgi:hypothetical protein